MILQDILLVLLYMFCKKGHKAIAKQSISEDQSAEETGKIGTTVRCIHLYHFFYTGANSNKYNNNFLSNLSADYCSERSDFIISSRAKRE